MKTTVLTGKSPAFEQVKAIRFTVFCEEQNVPLSLELDEYDADDSTRYVLVTDGAQAAATGRLIMTDKGYKLGRIATLRAYRGKGLGAAVVNALCCEAADCGASSVYLEAQLHAIPFYEKCGFRVASNEIIMDAGIAHKMMIKEWNNGKSKEIT